MPITFHCDKCGTMYKVAEQYAGKKTTCRKCSAILTIPSATPEPGPLNSLDPPAIGFAGADDPVPPPTSARPLNTPMYRGPAEDSSEDPPNLGTFDVGGKAPPPLMRSLPKVERAAGGDAAVFDYRPAVPPRQQGGRKPSQARPDEISKLLIWLVVLATVGLIIYSYTTWPTPAITSMLQKANVSQDVLTTLGRPHSMLLLPPLALLACVFLLVAPAILLAWFITTRITNTSMPDDAYVRSVGMACLPVVMLLIALFTPFSSDPIMKGVIILASAPVAWLMLNSVHGLKVSETAITLVFSLIFGTVALVLTIFIFAGISVSTGVGYGLRMRPLIEAQVQARHQAEYDQYITEQKKQAEAIAQRQKDEQERAQAHWREQMNARTQPTDRPAFPGGG